MHFDRPYGPLRKKIWARFVINAHVWIVVSVSEVICPKRETKLSRSVRSSIPRYARHFSSPLTIIPRYAGQGTRCIKPRLPWHAASSQSPIYHHCTSLIQLVNNVPSAHVLFYSSTVGLIPKPGNKDHQANSPEYYCHPAASAWNEGTGGH